MKNTARSRKIMRHPTRVLIRHRSGNIRDHPFGENGYRRCI